MSSSRDRHLPYDQDDAHSAHRAERDRPRMRHDSWHESWANQPTVVLSEDASSGLGGGEQPYLEDNRTLPLDSRAFHGLAEEERPLGHGQGSRPRRAFDLGDEETDAFPEEPWDRSGAGAGPAIAPEQMREVVLRRQKADFGRIQFLPGLLGWLVAVGAAAVLFCGVDSVADLFGVAGVPDRPGAVLSGVGPTGQAFAGAHGVWLVVFGLVYALAFFLGGCAAGRAGRFSGAKQGVATFLWTLAATAVASIVEAAAGVVPEPSAFMVSVQALGGQEVVAGLACGLCVLVISLVFGILGGLWGTRFHRTADLVGFGLK